MTLTTNEAAEEKLSAVELTADEYHSLLADTWRRMTLEILSERIGSIGFRELVAEIVARENDRAVADEKAIKLVATALHHIHLPKMAEMGVLDYDPDTHWITPRGIPPFE